MAEGYGMPVDEVQGDGERRPLDQLRREQGASSSNANNPTNFERTWKNITFVYRELGLIGTPVRFDEVMDFSVIKQLDAAGTFTHQKDEYRGQLRAHHRTRRCSAEAPILTQTIRINFYPNSANIYEPQHDEIGKADRQHALRPDRRGDAREGGAARRPVRARGDRGRRPHRLAR